MVLKISVKGNAQKKIKGLLQLREIFSESKRSALSSVGFFWIEEIQEWIFSQGEGSWENSQFYGNLARTFQKKYRVGNNFSEREGKYTPFGFLANLSRYIVRSENKLVVNWGTFSSRKQGAKKGKIKDENLKFSNQLNRIAKRVQRGNKVRVTPQMRKLFALGTRTDNYTRPGVPGENYFPIPDRTKTLVIPPRKIFDPVFKRTSLEATRLFGEKLQSAVKRRFDKI